MNSDCVKSQGLTNLLENLETTKNGNQIGKTEKFPVLLNLGWYKSWSNDVLDITTFLVFDSNTSTIVSRIPELWRPLLQFLSSSACWAQLLVSISCLSLIPIEPIGSCSLAFESPSLHTMKIAFGYEASQKHGIFKSLVRCKVCTKHLSYTGTYLHYSNSKQFCRYARKEWICESQLLSANFMQFCNKKKGFSKIM